MAKEYCIPILELHEIAKVMTTLLDMTSPVWVRKSDTAKRAKQIIAYLENL